MLSIFFIDNSLNKCIRNINYRYIPVFLRINDTGEHNSLMLMSPSENSHPPL